MTAPLDPLNTRPKSKNSSRPSMDIADKILASDLKASGDGRWRYLDHLGAAQTDLIVAQRAGCNVSYVAHERRAKYGNLVPHITEEAKAARRVPQKKAPFVYPHAELAAVADAPTTHQIERGAQVMKSIFDGLKDAIVLLTSKVVELQSELSDVRYDTMATRALLEKLMAPTEPQK